jgi:hypothetical protein
MKDLWNFSIKNCEFFGLKMKLQVTERNFIFLFLKERSNFVALKSLNYKLSF